MARMVVTGLRRSLELGRVALLSKTIVILRISMALILVSQASAQESAVRYIEYPQLQGKVQPLELSGVPKWATFDSQLRARFESQSSDSYISGNEQAYVLTRIYGGMEVRPTHWLTGYIQFIDAQALGLPLKYTAANQRDLFDDRQAYLELHLERARIVAGRQELKYGGERLVGISDWTNDSRTWDGFLGRFGGDNRIDVFATSVVTVHPTSLDKHGAGLTFFGAVGTVGTWVPHTVVQPFVFVKAFPTVQGTTGVFGTQTTVTPGAEAAGDYHGFDFDALGALQRGSYANRSIEAAAGYVKAGYSAAHIWWQPRLRAEYDYASGNPQGDPLRMGTFDQQYPSNHNAFGLTDLFGYQNIKQERINLDMTPVKHLTVLIQEESLQVASRFDNVYSGSAGTTVKAPVTGFRSGDIGHEFDASGKYLFNSYLVMNAGIGHLSSGTLMRENAHGAPLTLAYLGLTYRFKVNRKDVTP
jgi:hypothetical protein